MRPAFAPSAPPTTPHSVSNTFQASPSFEPSQAWATSIAAEYAPTSSAPRSTGRALGPSALSAMNPTSAKAAMLYAFRSSTWNESSPGDVISYTTSLVAIQNSAAATSNAPTFQRHFFPFDSEESS